MAKRFAPTVATVVARIAHVRAVALVCRSLCPGRPTPETPTAESVATCCRRQASNQALWLNFESRFARKAVESERQGGMRADLGCPPGEGLRLSNRGSLTGDLAAGRLCPNACPRPFLPTARGVAVGGALGRGPACAVGKTVRGRIRAERLDMGMNDQRPPSGGRLDEEKKL